jgi:hypothetical protein
VNEERTARYSLGCFGPFIAAFLSYKLWGSVGWALLHFCCGWFYVLYWVIFYSGWIK